MTQLAFLIVSSTPSLQNIAHFCMPLFLAESTYFHCFSYIYLSYHFKHLDIITSTVLYLNSCYVMLVLARVTWLKF